MAHPEVPATTPANFLQSILGDQLQAQHEYYGQDPGFLTGDEAKDYIRTQALALHAEVSEILAAVPWKPWASRTDFDTDNFQEECMDALFFLVNLMLTTTIDANEWCRVYDRVRDKNRARRAGDYTGDKGGAL